MALARVHGGLPFDLEEASFRGDASLRKDACVCDHSTAAATDDAESTDVESIESNSADGEKAPLFLLWHRAYIHALELSLQSIMRENWKDDEWKTFRLPYWDWTTEPYVPAEFLSQDLDPQYRWGDEFEEPVVRCLLDTGELVFSRNPLYDCLRANGLPTKTDYDRDHRRAIIDFALWDNPYDSKRRSVFSGFSADFYKSWHSVIHTSVGTEIGADMGMQQTAARDPLFWLHHANVDRLWTIWVKEHQQKSKAPAVPDYSGQWRDRRYQFPVYISNGTTVFYRPEYKELSTNSISNMMEYYYVDLQIPKVAPTADVSFVKSSPVEFNVCDVRSLNGDTPFAYKDRHRYTVMLAQVTDLEVPAGGVTIRFHPGDIAAKDILDVLARRKKPIHCEKAVGSLCAYDSLFVRFDELKETPLGHQMSAYQVFVSAGVPQEPLPFDGHYVGSLDLFRHRSDVGIVSDTVGLLGKTDVVETLNKALAPAGGGSSTNSDIYLSVRPVSRSQDVPLDVTRHDAVLKVKSLSLEGRGSHLKEDQRVCRR